MFEQDFPMPIGEVSEDGLIASKTGAITAALEIVHAGCHQSAEAYEGLNQTLVKAIGMFPHGPIFMQQDRFWRQAPGKPPANAEPRPFLARASDAHFFGQPFFDHRTYILITQPAIGSKPATWGSLALLRRHLVPATLLDEEKKRVFLETVAQFEYTLRNSRLCEIRRLAAEELRSDGRPGLIEQYWSLTPPDHPPVIGDIAFKKDAVYALNRPCVIYTLADAEQLPEQCSPWSRYHPYSTASTTLPIGSAAWLGPLWRSNIFVKLVLLCAAGPGQSPRADLEKKAETAQARVLRACARENAAARDDARKCTCKERLPASSLRSGCTSICWPGPNPGKNCRRSNNRSPALPSSQLGAIPRLETVGAAQLWSAGIPGNADQLPLQDTLINFLEQAACFLIKDRLDQDSTSSFGIRFCDRHSGRPLHVDISDEAKRKQWVNNLNKAVLASSGGGKTFLMLLMIKSYFDQGAHIVIVDIGGSYRRLCTLLKGQYFAYTKEQPICLNPFRLEKDELPDTEKKESQISLLLTLWKKQDETFRRSEYIALSNALHGYYQWLAANPYIQAGFNSFYVYLQGMYTAELKEANVRKEDFDIDNFLYVLRPYYSGGEYDYLLNAEDLPSLLTERLIVFDIDAIKDHPILFPVVTIIIMEVFISKMRRLHGVRKVIVIEEAWKAIAKEGMDEYIKYLFKTVRKFFGEAIVVTQEIEDIISSPVVRNTIINNADLQRSSPTRASKGEQF